VLIRLLDKFASLERGCAVCGQPQHDQPLLRLVFDTAALRAPFILSSNRISTEKTTDKSAKMSQNSE
jgi:hypothetical protein